MGVASPARQVALDRPAADASPARSPVHGLRRSLPAKALALFAALGALVLSELVLAFLLFEDVERHFTEMENLDRQQRQLVASVVQVRDLLLDIQFASSGDGHTVLGHWLGDLDVMLEVDEDVGRRMGPEAMGMLADLRRRAAELSTAETVTQDALISLGEDLESDVGEYNSALLAHLSQLETDRADLMAHADAHRHAKITFMAVLGGAGLTVMGIVGGLFLMRLLQAMRQLGQQATRIAKGDYGQLMPVERSDELGQVVEAVNAMSAGLASRERELVGLRSRYGQQERMFAMGVLAAQMAHELGNPIQAIMALSLHAADSLRGDQSRETVFACIDHLDVIARHAERLTGTVCDIREFARPERLEREFVDLNEVVENTVRLMRFERRFARTGVQLELAGALPPVHAVRDHVAQILVNLLINAADAVPAQGGRIVVATRAMGDSVAISVTDNGCGMEDAVKALVFEAFFTTKLSDNGTGLGLTICKQIAQDHGGRIAIDSTVGKGTAVTVLLPKG
jgi:signal transduction histidine kinase